MLQANMTIPQSQPHSLSLALIPSTFVVAGKDHLILPMIAFEYSLAMRSVNDREKHDDRGGRE